MVVNSTTIHGDSVRMTQPPQAAKFTGEIILPGKFKGRPWGLQVSEDILSKHILLLGGTGCGKTNVFNFFIQQIQNNMTKDDVMVVFDTKGDFVKRFFRHNDVVLANSKKYSAIAEKWNIYKEIVIDGWLDDDIIANTNEITHSFFKEATEKTTQVFFPNAARDLLASIIIAHLRLAEDDLEYKNYFLNNKALRQALDEISVEKVHDLLLPNVFPDLSSVLSYLGDGSSDQGLGVISELQSTMRQILMGAFACDGRFSVRNFIRGKGAKTLFIEYDLSIGDTLSPIYRLLFDLALKEALGRNKSEGNVYIICDEFKLLPYLQHIEDAVNFGRSLGVKILAGIQSINQLYEIYGEHRGKNIAAGFSSVFAFKANDSSTRKFVSELYGENIVLEQYKASNNTLIEEKRAGKTVEDWDINNLQIGEAVVGLPYKKPFLFQFDLYNG